MKTPTDDHLPVVSLEELQHKGLMMVRGTDRPIALYHDNGKIHAFDNRCPHLGFPLHQGTVKDGILTCHWHHAKFDVCSGCTFDLFADDIPTFETKVEEGMVCLARRPSFDANHAYYGKRLNRGLKQGIALVQTKSIIGLVDEPDDPKNIIRQIAKFGATNHEEWSSGMTTLSVVANLLPFLDRETTIHALACAARRIAEDCRTPPARRERGDMPASEASPAQLKRWFRHWLHIRHRDAAERTLLTALQHEHPTHVIEDLLFDSISDRVYGSRGHVLDFTNKACELLHYLDWDHAKHIFPTVINQMVQSQGAEESGSWRDPVDLIALIQTAEAKLAKSISSDKDTEEREGLAEVLLGSDPVEIINTLTEELQRGVPTTHLTRIVAYAAARRLAHFSSKNDSNDWFFPIHTFTHANAVHQSAMRTDTEGTRRGLFHAALAVYQDRFLNVPLAPLPRAKLPPEALSTDGDALLQKLPELLDQVGNLTPFTDHVAGYIRSGHELQPLANALTMLVLREDVDFHHLQILEAGLQQAQYWWGKPEAEHVLVGVARTLAAHCPTRRTSVYITNTALRLHRGDTVD